jgi:hypothetical protein
MQANKPPAEPTSEMMEAGMNAFRKFMRDDILIGDHSLAYRQRIIREIYLAMVEASK